MFKLSYRAFSQGYMRVDNPAKFGEVLLWLALPRAHYTAERLMQAWGGPEKWVKFRRKISVYVVYMSAFVNENGRLMVRKDLYGIDKKVNAVLKGDPRYLAAMEAA